MVTKRSWQLVSVVTVLKENSVFDTNLVSDLAYVHVLVTFVVTFSRSGAHQYCYCMLDCRRPYSPRKINLGPIFWEKEKVKDKIVGRDLFDLCLLYFGSVIDCKIWCSLVVVVLKRFICNLCCVPICQL